MIMVLIMMMMMMCFVSLSQAFECLVQVCAMDKLRHNAATQSYECCK